jgi:hypothetical protein
MMDEHHDEEFEPPAGDGHEEESELAPSDGHAGEFHELDHHIAEPLGFEDHHDDAVDELAHGDEIAAVDHEHDDHGGGIGDAEHIHAPLAAPGGSVFSLHGGGESAAVASPEHLAELRSAVHGDRYAEAWASDDGTGMIAAILPDPHPEPHAGPGDSGDHER